MRTEAEVIRDQLREESIGPHNSAVMLGPTGPEIFFKVTWTREMKLVAEASRHDEMLDSETQWIYFKTDPTHSCALTIEWKGLGIRVVLFFELPKWKPELEILRAAHDIVVLGSDEMTGYDMLVKGIALEADCDIWETILR